jgi:hypothetical protein
MPDLDALRTPDDAPVGDDVLRRVEALAPSGASRILAQVVMTERSVPVLGDRGVTEPSICARCV